MSYSSVSGRRGFESAEESIKAGMLQIIASQFVGQATQRSAGKSEMYEGINKIFAVRQKARRYRQEQQEASAGKIARKRRKNSRRRVAGGNKPIEPSND
jgi:hypothetical protein